MDFNLQPWKLYLVILAGWVNRQQQEEIQYLLTENQVLKEKLGKKSVRMKVRGVLEAPSIAAFCLIGRGLTCKVVCKRQPSRWPATHDKPAFHRVF